MSGLRHLGTPGLNKVVTRRWIFQEEKRSDQTHASTTDPEASLARKVKGKEARLSFAGHVVMENRSGLVVNACTTEASGTCERGAALEMLSEIEGEHRVKVGTDKANDTRDENHTTRCTEEQIGN